MRIRVPFLLVISVCSSLNPTLNFWPFGESNEEGIPKGANAMPLEVFVQYLMNHIEILKFAGIPSVVLALVMYVARKQTQILAQGNTVHDINDSFAQVPGPVVSAVFSDRDPSEQVEIQKKIIPMLHQLNYLCTLWSLRHLKVLRVIPCPLLSRKDWELYCFSGMWTELEKKGVS
jgi:hypothetical protein